MPKVQPVGGVGVVSVTVHTVPVGMSLTVVVRRRPPDVAGVGAAVVVDGERTGEARAARELFVSFRLPGSRVSVLLVVTSTVASFVVMVTVAVGENVGVPKV